MPLPVAERAAQARSQGLLEPCGLPLGQAFRRLPSRRPGRPGARYFLARSRLAPKEYSAADMRRIRRQGPNMADLTRVLRSQIPGTSIELDYPFAPREAVMGLENLYTPEPRWRSLPFMPFMELFDGLQRRNWTSPRHDPALPKWELQFFKDGGRLLRPGFYGWRVVVHCPAEGWTRWANLDRAGPDAFLRDYSGGGFGGAIWRAKRLPQPLVSPAQYGWNQIFEQLFQAFEERLTPAQMADAYWDGYAPRPAHAYSCPADAQIGISFHHIRPEYSLAWFWLLLPKLLVWLFATGFLGTVLAVGIFKPRRQMPNDIFSALEFAQSKGQARKDGTTGVKLADVGGIGAVVEELRDVVGFLKSPLRYMALKARPPKGILLEGDPGTGKTLVAKAIAGEAGVAFYQMSGSEFVEAIVGVGAARVRDLFARAMVNAPCIVFVDEIDALGIRRADAGVSTNEEREQTLNQLLTEMDGFSPSLGVVFVGATNRADLLDPALMRAGRFDRRVRINRPDEAGRLEILRIHAGRARFDPGVDLAQLARDLPGLTGAELGNVVNEAVLEAVRRRAESVSQRDLDNGVDRVVQGVRRPPLAAGYAARAALAAHEAGRAIATTVLRAERGGRVEAVERVSIVGRGRELSRTVFARGRDEDYLLVTRGRALDRLRVLLAGRAAEEVLHGAASTYGNGALQDARRLALRVVTSYGMSDLGLTSFDPPQVPSVQAQLYAFEVTADRIDDDLFGHRLPGGGFQPAERTWDAICKEANRLMIDAYNDDLRLLHARRGALVALSDALLEREQVLADEVHEILARERVDDGVSYDDDDASISSSSSSSPALRLYKDVFDDADPDAAELRGSLVQFKRLYQEQVAAERAERARADEDARRRDMAQAWSQLGGHPFFGAGPLAEMDKEAERETEEANVSEEEIEGGAEGSGVAGEQTDDESEEQ